MLKILKMKITANDIHIGERETNHWKWLVKTFTPCVMNRTKNI